MNQSGLLSKHMACLLAARSACTNCSSPCSSGSTASNGIPVGGATNQVLTKNSNSDYDVTWANKYNLIIVNIYDDGTDYACNNVNTEYNIPTFIGTAVVNKTPSSFDITLNSVNYNINNFPLYSVNCFYLTEANIWRYTSVRVGNVTGSILNDIDTAVTTISFSGITRGNMVSAKSTSSGMYLRIFIQILN